MSAPTPLLPSATSWAQTDFDSEAFCRRCHGLTARGWDPIAGGRFLVGAGALGGNPESLRVTQAEASRPC